jgi:hypothetical protein
VQEMAPKGRKSLLDGGGEKRGEGSGQADGAGTEGKEMAMGNGNAKINPLTNHVAGFPEKRASACLWRANQWWHTSQRVMAKSRSL